MASRGLEPVEDVVVLSDPHFGSTVAVCPPEVLLDDGAKYVASPLQRYIWSCWERFRDEFIPAKVNGRRYGVVLNGDMIEGVHHNTKQVFHHDTQFHFDVAAECLRPICEDAEWVLMVRGTEAHTGSIEDGLGFVLGALRNVDTSRHSADRWNFSVKGVQYNATHHITSTKRPWTEASGMGLAMNNEIIECVKAGHPVPRVMLRAHRHKYGMFSDGYAMLVVTPPWQALTRFGHKVVPSARGAYGGVVLSHHGRDHGELPICYDGIYRPEPPQSLEL